MAYTYEFIPNASDPCFLDVIRTDTSAGGPYLRLDRQFNLSFVKWEEKGDDDLTIFDGYSTMTLDIDEIPAFGTVALLIAFLEPLRAACSLIPAGGWPVIPAPVNGTGTYTYNVVTDASTIAAGFESVSLSNLGTANVLINDGTAGLKKLAPGQSENIASYYNPVTGVLRLTPAIIYDATAVGAELKISTYL